MSRNSSGVLKGWASSSTGSAGRADAGRLQQSRRKDPSNALGSSLLPSWGLDVDDPGTKRPQRSCNRPGTPRPSAVEPLQSQGRGASTKENVGVAGQVHGQASKERSLRRLQQRAALQSLNNQHLPQATPSASTARSSPDLCDEQDVGTEGRQLEATLLHGSYGAHHKSTPAASPHSPAVAPARPGRGRAGPVPRLDFSQVPSTDSSAEGLADKASVDCSHISSLHLCHSGPLREGADTDSGVGVPLAGGLQPFNPTCLAMSAPGSAQGAGTPGPGSPWSIPGGPLLPEDQLTGCSPEHSGADAALASSAAAARGAAVDFSSTAAAEAVLQALDCWSWQPSAFESLAASSSTPGVGEDSADTSPQSADSPQDALTPACTTPSPDGVHRSNWSPFMRPLLEDTVKGLFQSPFRGRTMM